jgi:hypothetical protein
VKKEKKIEGKEKGVKHKEIEVIDEELEEKGEELRIIDGKLQLTEKDLERLINLFFFDIIFTTRKWVGKEIPVLHRLFLKDICILFKLWYKSEINKEVEILFDKFDFGRIFVKKLKSKKIGYKLKKLVSEYSQKQGAWRFRFNSLRLTTLGQVLYLKNIMADVINYKKNDPTFTRQKL